MHDVGVKFAYLAAFATALLYGVSAVLEDRAAKAVPITGVSGKRAAVKTTLSPVYVVGMILSILAWFASLIALRRLPLFAVQAIAAGSIGVVVLITWALTNRPPHRRDAVLLVALALGLVALAVSAAPGRPHHTTVWFRIGIVIGVVVVAIAAWFAAKSTGRRGSAALGAVSGLADGGMALCARALHLHAHHRFHIFIDPVAWSILLFAIIGVITFAGSLQRGPASVALACQQAVLTIVPSAIGLAVLGDRAKHGYIPLTIVGFIVTVAAVLLLTLHPGEPVVGTLSEIRPPG
ncbi:MAG: putative integral rane protein [Ilumatobacteraceae bacterium]|nr:putative integral rane protein [Ilumatobacteraceae bacterium]